MNIIFDVVILLMIFLFALIGKKRGFIKTFFGFFESIVSFVLSSILARPVGSFLGEKIIEPVISKYFIEKFLEKSGDITAGMQFDSLSESNKELLSRFHIDGPAFDSFFTSTSESATESLEKVAHFVAEPLASSLGYAFSLFALFIIISLLIRMIVKVLDLISKLPFLNFSNHALGFVAGLCQGLVLAVVVSSLIVLFEPLMKSAGSEFLKSFDSEKTVLIKLFSSFDLFKNFIV